MSDGQAFLNLIPFVVGAGVTIAAMKYLLPEGQKSVHETFSKSDTKFKSALEAAGV
jgi:hypothetical protein